MIPFWGRIANLTVGRGQEGGRGQASSQVGREAMKPSRMVNLDIDDSSFAFSPLFVSYPYIAEVFLGPFFGVRCNINTVCGL
jgi:hypothetical protein